MSEAGPMMGRMCTCGGDAEVTQIDVLGNGMTIGLAGVALSFQTLYDAGVAPDEEAGEQLLGMIKVQNYVPRGAEPKYKAALLREYAAFYQRKRNR